MPARCQWSTGDLMIGYHDREWGVPLHDDQKLFELLMLEGAQAGLSWEIVLRKRESYREAFDHFDARKMVAYGQNKIADLLQNPGIVRNRLKVAAFVQNAGAYLDLQIRFRQLRRLPLEFRRRPSGAKLPAGPVRGARQYGPV